MTDFEDEDIPDLEDEDHPFTDDDASEPPSPTPWRDFIASGTDKAISARFVEEATQLLEKHDKVADMYACFGLLDESSGIGEWELSRMFAALRRRNPDRDTDVLLILQGPGGSIEHAYQISKALSAVLAGVLCRLYPEAGEERSHPIGIGRRRDPCRPPWTPWPHRSPAARDACPRG